MQLRLPWTVSFVYRQARYLSLFSAWRYRCQVCRELRGTLVPGELLPLRVRMLPGRCVWVRCGTSDYRTLDEVFRFRVYESVVAAIPPCRTVIDLGGNIGLAARYFTAVYPDCQIVSVEPDAENQELFRRNMASVPVSRWRLIPAAVWRDNAPVAIATPDNPTDYDSIRVVPGSNGDCAVEGLTPVEIIRRSGFQTVDLMKIDVEGAEAELFTGDLAWLDRVRAIAIEFHADSRKRSGFDEIMPAQGFIVRDLNRHTVLAIR